MADGADVLIYGCELAKDSAGEALVATIAALTGGNVAASDDLTGAASLGGDWHLEYSVGEVAAPTLQVFSYSSVLVAPVIDLDGDDSTATGLDYATAVRSRDGDGDGDGDGDELRKPAR